MLIYVHQAARNTSLETAMPKQRPRSRGSADASARDICSVVSGIDGRARDKRMRLAPASVHIRLFSSAS